MFVPHRLEVCGALGLSSVGSVDLCVNRVVGVAGREDAVMSVGQDRGQRGEARTLGLVEHLALQLGELVLQLGESVGQSLHDARVNGVKDSVLGCAQVLGSLECSHVVAPELCLVCESGVLCVEVELHLAQSSVGHLCLFF